MNRGRKIFPPAGENVSQSSHTSPRSINSCTPLLLLCQAAEHTTTQCRRTLRSTMDAQGMLQILKPGTGRENQPRTEISHHILPFPHPRKPSHPATHPTQPFARLHLAPLPRSPSFAPTMTAKRRNKVSQQSFHAAYLTLSLPSCPHQPSSPPVSARPPHPRLLSPETRNIPRQTGSRLRLVP